MPKPRRDHRIFHYRELTGASWNGLPVTLQVNQSTAMAQTTTGSMLLAWYNTNKQNNDGTLTLSSGGSMPVAYDAPAQAYQPSILLQNWNGDNLNLTNTSLMGKTIPIWVSAFAPGLPGAPDPQPLPADGSTVTLNTLATAQGQGQSRWMQLGMVNTTGTLAIVAMIGGKPDSAGNNGYVIALNAAATTGPGTSTPAPAGYYATTTNTFYNLRFNVGAATIFVAAMSPDTTLGVDLTLLAL